MFRALGRVWGAGALYRRDGVEVRERDGVRTLHLGSDTVQSAMRVERPDDLELSYTRAMMAFLLFGAWPKTVLLVGLGGGSLVKYVYRTMPETKVQVVEINPAVVEVARKYFCLPQDDHRLAIWVGDGAELVQRIEKAPDIMLIDAYDGNALAASLATEEFFVRARRALSPNGMLLMNLWSNDRWFDRNVQRIERAFSGRCVCLPAERPGNVVVIGFAGVPEPESLRWASLRERASVLEERFGLEFTRFVANLRQMNLHDGTGLRLAGQALDGAGGPVR